MNKATFLGLPIVGVTAAYLTLSPMFATLSAAFSINF